MKDLRQCTVLVVDDVKDNIRLLVEALKDEFSIGFALNGQAALAYAKKHRPDLVLLDIMMPEMDGFEVCRRLKADPETRDIPVLFLSALEDVKDKTVGFTVGGVDYITKPFHILEVKARVRTHLLLKTALETIRGQRDRMQDSLNLAMEVQQSLIPKKPPAVPGWEGAANIRYCDETGGDYFDWLVLKTPHGPHLGLAVGDVSEHGVPSALLMTTARALLRLRAGTDAEDVAAVMGDVNRLFSEDVKDSGRFMTLFFAVCDPKTREISYVNAGHEPPCLIHPNGRTQILAQPRGLPLGIEPNQTYRAGQVALPPGGALAVYTDGLYEAMGEKDGRMARDRILETAVQHRGASAQTILQALMDPDHLPEQGECLLDDVTVLVLKAAG